MTKPPLTATLSALAEVAAIDQLIDQPGTIVVPEAARALAIAAASNGAGKTAGKQDLTVVVTPTMAETDRLSDDLMTLLGDSAVEVFPPWETLPFERVSPNVETMGRRSRTLWRVRSGDPTLAVVVMPVRAATQRLSSSIQQVEPISLHTGQQRDQEAFVEQLIGWGYRREYQVEHRGEIAVRGSIVDVYPTTGHDPLRVDFWGDEIDRLTAFSVADQRTTNDVDHAELFPAREFIPTAEEQQRAGTLTANAPWGREHWERLAAGEQFDGMEAWLPWISDSETSFLSFVEPQHRCYLVEPRLLRDRSQEILADEQDLGLSLARTWGMDEADEDLPRLHLELDDLLGETNLSRWDIVTLPPSPDVPALSIIGWPPAVGEAEGLLAQIRDVLAQGFQLVVCAEGEGSAARVAKLLGQYDLSFPIVSEVEHGKTGGAIVVAPLERGCVIPDAKIAVLAEADLSGRRRTHRAARVRKRDAQRFFDELEVGTHVVHVIHGVGRFEGMVKRTIGGVERDYLLIEYRGGDRLYIPSDQIETIRPYTGGETPKLNKMGGADFSRAKAKVRSAVAEIAQELVVLYQKRVSAEGTVFSPDTPWQTEMEQSFPFQETVDQLSAIEDVKADMERSVPMDRLICGDVGFGKTEVALRAAFKAVQDGYQVAVLVPTTLLAQQHMQTFSERFAGYPVRVEVLSRFLTAAQARKIIADTNAGEVDVLVGTHRLLSSDLQFKNLGLLVVDEEQRFGVSHKEAIKNLKADVDVLTLSATPIPRTLEMSLTGIRDLSLLNTPPAERQPILTYVGEYDERAVSEAIRRELLREGQVFYVHNRVRDIELQAARIKELVPEARVAVAHGQMDEGTLEQVVIDFWEGNYDVLVCTTIIESGIDMPTVNTLVVERADLLGLGQLHQLRGRVGRSGQRAYAYLFFPKDRQLSEQAFERLKTIGEATELGSGFRIAMRDLEIRGAGNLLGTGQSGHIAAVGYDLYVQMVNEAINTLNGQEVEETPEITLELPVAAFLPEDYVEREDVRLETYRRLAAVKTEAEVDDIAAEWVDRFGPVPEPATALLELARLRAVCVGAGITEIIVTKNTTLSGGGMVALISPIKLAQSRQMRLARLAPKSRYNETTGELKLPVKPSPALANELAQTISELIAPPQKKVATSRR